MGNGNRESLRVENGRRRIDEVRSKRKRNGKRKTLQPETEGGHSKEERGTVLDTRMDLRKSRAINPKRKRSSRGRLRRRR